MSHSASYFNLTLGVTLRTYTKAKSAYLWSWPYNGEKGRRIERRVAAVLLSQWRNLGHEVHQTQWGYFYPKWYGDHYHVDSPHVVYSHKERENLRRLYGDIKEKR